ncbi:hypothetical protein GCM10010269_15710 [Streptomyces humidus]|uniref:DUF3592 domain-containing protein n=1 Tax=Streptomyces humidus TaxID=52259 RepID=A0A918FTH9_9ACTN|nr:DUF3592 domain-containing protein [Streptomyces humidus]GGR77300.1 hypothetical protein GCM10010269_15710 [Streptomyces humidus]
MTWDGWDGFVLLWCAAWGGVALVGYGRSLAGMTEAQRTVRLTGRIERVREPRHGGSRKGGISVVVSYRDPVSGQEVTVTNDGERGEMITSAWKGREIEVSHPRDRPHAYRFSDTAAQPDRGTGLPNAAVFLAYAALVILVSVRQGWPWALIGFCGPWALLGIAYLPGAVRERTPRLSTLAAMDTTRGRIIAVLQDITVDQDDSHTSTTITPVVSFATREGTAVTAHCTSHLADPATAYGREVTVHHTSHNPVEFTLDRVAEHRSSTWDLALHVLMIVVLATAAVVGVALL